MKPILTMIGLLVPVAALAADAGKDTDAACADRARAWFEQTHGDGKKAPKDGRTVTVGYEARYHQKLKQCLVRVTTEMPASGKRPAVSNVTVREVGTKGSAWLASLTRVGGQVKHCVVEGRKCTSEREWETLAAPLMKE
jgi:hypothetical protein